jgi:hypothetical protein
LSTITYIAKIYGLYTAMNDALCPYAALIFSCTVFTVSELYVCSIGDGEEAISYGELILTNRSQTEGNTAFLDCEKN